MKDDDKVQRHPAWQAEIDAKEITNSHMEAQRRELIEHYAGIAMGALIGSEFSSQLYEGESQCQHIAKMAVVYAETLADEVLKEREK